MCAIPRLANEVAVSGGDFCGHCGGAGVSAIEVSHRRCRGHLHRLYFYALFATAWIVTGTWFMDAIWAVLPTGILTVGILHANNLRDARTDTEAGIRTLASVLGQKRSVWRYQFEMLVPFAIMLERFGLECFTDPACGFGSDGSLQAGRTVDGVNTASIATLDASTPKTQLMFSMLMVAGLVAGHWMA